uniref:BRICHOS domain-containing protein n=1 Tax=Latimeria chalumnae TaxID=7897 RepID=H2ZUU2_LATCH
MSATTPPSPQVLIHSPFTHTVTHIQLGLIRNLLSSFVFAVGIHTYGNDGKVTQQTVNIDNVGNVASVNINAGQQSSSSVFDYNNGFIGYRLFLKKSCYVAKMNKAKIPTLEQISKIVHEAKDEKQTAPPHGVQYTVSSTPVKNPASLGKSIDTLCRDVPTYWAHEIEGQQSPMKSSHSFTKDVMYEIVLKMTYCSFDCYVY